MCTKYLSKTSTTWKLGYISTVNRGTELSITKYSSHPVANIWNIASLWKTTVETAWSSQWKTAYIWPWVWYPNIVTKAWTPLLSIVWSINSSSDLFTKRSCWWWLGCFWSSSLVYFCSKHSPDHHRSPISEINVPNKKTNFSMPQTKSEIRLLKVLANIFQKIVSLSRKIWTTLLSR